MPATDDRWDVVVVGLRDPSHAAAMMAVAELAHYASIPPQDVERMLEEGEVPILENLDRAEAERAAYELAELGAQVDLRLAMTESGVFPVFKPDAERQIGVAVGGLIDDSATPPTVGAAVGLPELEPDPETPQEPRPRSPSSRPTTRRASEDARARSITPAPGEGGSRSRATTPVPGEGGPRSRATTPVPGDSGSRSRSISPTPSDSGSRSRATTPAPSDSGSRSRATTPAPSDSGSRSRATTPAPSDGSSRSRGTTPAPGTDSGSGRPRTATPVPGRAKAPNVDALLGDIGPAAPASPKLPQRLQRAAAAAAQAPAELELDFEAAGLTAPPKRGPMGIPVPLEPASDRNAMDMPRRTRAGQMGGTGASAAGHVHRTGGTLELLRSDGVAMLLVGLGVGLVLSLVLALQLQRSSARDTLPPLEEELAASLADPADVATGKRRDPAVIEAEIDEALDDLQRSFLLWWLAPGVVVGLLLSRLKEG